MSITQVQGTITLEETNSRDSIVEAAAGEVVNERTVSVTGRNDTVTNEEFIWTNGGSHTFNAAAGDLVFVSDNAADDIAGSGARTLLIEYLDANADAVITNIVLSGTTPVTISNVWRLNAARVSSAGTYHGANTGTISITLAGNTRGQILPGEGKMQSLIYSTPANTKAHFLGYKISSQDGSLGSANVTLRIYGATPFDSATAASFEGFDFFVSGGRYDTITRNLPTIPEKSDIWITAEWTSGGSALVSGAMNFYLRPV